MPIGSNKISGAAAATASTLMQQRVEKIRRVAGRSLNNNVRSLPAMSSPPTLAGSNARIAGNDHYYPLQDSGVIQTLHPFDISGGYTYLNPGSGQVTFPCVRDSLTTGGNIDNSGRRASVWHVRFMTDAPSVCFGILGYSTSYRFSIDDGTGNKFVSSTPFASPSGGGLQYINMTFSASAPSGRMITIESQASAFFSHILIGNTYSAWKPTRADRVKAGVIGDSIDGATGATFQGDGFANVMGDYLGAFDVWQMGLGGTGYVSPGPTWKYGDHISDWTVTSTDWDLLVFTGGNNDDSYGGAAVQVNALDVLTRTRAALPQTPIIVFGPDATAGLVTGQNLDVENGIKAAVATLNSPTIQFIPLLVLPEGNSEIFGTGNSSAPNSTGNSDRYTGPDGVHPTDAGHLFRGQFRAARIRAAIEVMASSF